MLHEPDFDDLDSNDFTDKELSDEDTEDASETDVAKQETQYTEIKEQMYQDKLAFLKKQLKQLEEGTLPEFLKRNKKIDQQYRERLKYMEVFKEYELEIIEREFKKEKKLSTKDLEEKKVDLKESLIADLEEKRRSIELERSQLELTGGHCNFLLSTSLDVIEAKPMSTRKLRRRPNDPIPIPEKRRKPASPAQINFYLDDGDIMDDLRIINKVGGKPLGRKPIPTIGPIDIITDVKIEDGRLYYDKRWFHRNQPVFVDCKDAGKFSGVITAIGTQEVWIRKTSDSSKIKIYLNQLQKGKFVLRRKQT
ncbi:sin3 histone deacetylase corepressor complex component SDS3-like [Mya arenaria]|uniref:sin3 histone deacetylase corepressor complex component SDS3-like n=1 Tax=Mya arenaria TaxID=6604 RepID=UPI0022E15834|nr:sin3 histone deacetylase corepressor complex component SDS3-like [Mya arenaria]XP_052801789.1 sin3 histone deacetylase corepressor complex component SDS3-like [Mya arenaria]